MPTNISMKIPKLTKLHKIKYWWYLKIIQISYFLLKIPKKEFYRYVDIATPHKSELTELEYTAKEKLKNYVENLKDFYTLDNEYYR